MATSGTYSWRGWITSAFVATALMTSGCADDGADGAPGAAAPAPIVSSDIPATFVASVDTATVAADGALTVNFTVEDDRGNGFVGLPSSQIRFTVAQLVPLAVDSTPSHWQSYINRTETLSGVDAPEPAGSTQIQATSETASANAAASAFTDHRDGSYSYTLDLNLKQVTTPKAVSYDPTRTHRVAFQISGGDLPVANGSFDWVPSGGPLVTRSIVTEQTCNSCHGELTMHGSRVDTDYCVTCHNPGSTDAETGRTLDLNQMVHKIHRGANLAEVVSGGEYSIWGYGGRNKPDVPHVYSEVLFPQDIRNCTSCHSGDDDEGNPLANVDNWKELPSREACGSCHDAIDWTKGYDIDDPTTHKGGDQADNALCTSCHGVTGPFPVEQYHGKQLDNQVKGRDKLSIDLLSATLISGTQVDVLVDITLNGAGVADFAVEVAPFVDTSRSYLLMNWDAGDGYLESYNRVEFKDCAPDPLLPVAGQLICPWTPPTSWNDSIAAATGTLAVTIGGLPLCVDDYSGDLIDCTTTDTRFVEKLGVIAITPVKAFYALEGVVGPLDSTDYSEKVAADVDRCNDCHKELVGHPTSVAAKDLAQCTSCHNASSSGYYSGRPRDLKSHVHSFHASNDSVNVEKNLGGAFGGSFYPGDISNCNACHSDGQFDLPLQENVRASASNDGGAVNVFTSPTAVVCSSCHISVPVGYIVGGGINGAAVLNGNEPEGIELTDSEIHWLNHMTQAGAVFGADTVDVATGAESCATCHSIDSDPEYGGAPVDKVHNLK